MNASLIEPGLFYTQTSASSELSVIHLNIRSLRSHFYDLLWLLSTLKHDFHFIALSETWLSNNTSNNFNIPGYNAQYSHRHTQSATFSSSLHGGVALYIKNTLPFKLRDDIKITTSLCESLFIEILPDPTSTSLIPHKRKNTIIGVIYRSPNNEVEDF